MSQLVCLGSEKDPHVNAVLDRVSGLGFKTAILDFNSKTEVLQKQNGETRILLDGADVSEAVFWFRVRSYLPEDVLKDLGERSARFTINEWLSLYNLISMICAGRVFNDRVATYQISSKIIQQKIARELGFSIPQSSLTNDRERAQLFYDNQARTITKAHGFPWVKALDTDGVMDQEIIMTTPVSSDDLCSATNEDFQICPVFLQEYIGKSYELRVVVIEESIWAYRIDSQASSFTEVDWRYGNLILDFDPVQLPDDICEKLRLFLTRANLSYGIFDLIVDKGNRYFFLEVNVDGQWLWMDDKPGISLADEFADFFRRKIENASS